MPVEYFEKSTIGNKIMHITCKTKRLQGICTGNNTKAGVGAKEQPNISAILEIAIRHERDWQYWHGKSESNGFAFE